MFSGMLDFCLELLQGVAVWLGSEPIVYLFGVVIICLAFKGFKGFFE